MKKQIRIEEKRTKRVEEKLIRMKITKQKGERSLHSILYVQTTIGWNLTLFFCIFCFVRVNDKRHTHALVFVHLVYCCYFCIYFIFKCGFCCFDIVERQRQLGRSIVERLHVRLWDLWVPCVHSRATERFEKNRGLRWTTDQKIKGKEKQETEALGAALYLSMCTPSKGRLRLWRWLWWWGRSTGTKLCPAKMQDPDPILFLPTIDN